MEVINNLLNYKDLKIIQNSDWFMFSLDSVLLANFVSITKKTTKIIDFGTGNAPIPLILTTKYKLPIIGVELQEEIYNLAVKSVKINHLEDEIKIIKTNIRDIGNYYSSGTFDLVTCNPPYFKYNSNSIVNENQIKLIARHEKEIDLESIIERASFLLRNGGSLAMVHRPERLIEIINYCQKYHLEPKRLQFVYADLSENAMMILFEARKNGKAGLKVLNPFLAHEKNGDYTEKVKEMFQ